MNVEKKTEWEESEKDQRLYLCHYLEWSTSKLQMSCVIKDLYKGFFYFIFFICFLFNCNGLQIFDVGKTLIFATQ